MIVFLFVTFRQISWFCFVIPNCTPALPPVPNKMDTLDFTKLFSISWPALKPKLKTPRIAHSFILAIGELLGSRRLKSEEDSPGSADLYLLLEPLRSEDVTSPGSASCLLDYIEENCGLRGQKGFNFSNLRRELCALCSGSYGNHEGRRAANVTFAIFAKYYDVLALPATARLPEIVQKGYTYIRCRVEWNGTLLIPPVLAHLFHAANLCDDVPQDVLYSFPPHPPRRVAKKRKAGSTNSETDEDSISFAGSCQASSICASSSTDTTISSEVEICNKDDEASACSGNEDDGIFNLYHQLKICQYEIEKVKKEEEMQKVVVEQIAVEYRAAEQEVETRTNLRMHLEAKLRNLMAKIEECEAHAANVAILKLRERFTQTYSTTINSSGNTIQSISHSPPKSTERGVVSVVPRERAEGQHTVAQNGVLSSVSSSTWTANTDGGIPTKVAESEQAHGTPQSSAVQLYYLENLTEPEAGGGKQPEVGLYHVSTELMEQMYVYEENNGGCENLLFQDEPFLHPNMDLDGQPNGAQSNEHSPRLLNELMTSEDTELLLGARFDCASSTLIPCARSDDIQPLQLQSSFDLPNQILDVGSLELCETLPSSERNGGIDEINTAPCGAETDRENSALDATTSLTSTLNTHVVEMCELNGSCETVDRSLTCAEDDQNNPEQSENACEIDMINTAAATTEHDGNFVGEEELRSTSSNTEDEEVSIIAVYADEDMDCISAATYGSPRSPDDNDDTLSIIGSDEDFDARFLSLPSPDA